MADTAQTKLLFKAVKAGDAAKIRELVAAGASLEATDPNRMTPVMLAAQAGHVDAFRALVDAGTDLHALALDQTDLLESAAEGGNVEIVRYLLDKGHPVDGHWKPRSKVAERLGHLTPLLMAAINGRVEAVRVLLEAGANREAKFDGQTAFKLIQDDIKHPNDEEEIKRVPQLKEIAALLKGSAGVPESPDDSASIEVGKFAENARRPAYKKLRQLLEERCGKARSWKPLPDHGLPASDVVGFTLDGCRKQKDIDELQEKARKASCHLVLAEPWASGEDAALVLFPTDDKFAVVAAVGTEGHNEGVATAQVISWLKDTDGENPFNLVYCGHDLVGGAFLRAVKGVKKLAERVVEICPSSLSEGMETTEELAAALKRQKTFFLRWD